MFCQRMQIPHTPHMGNIYYINTQQMQSSKFTLDRKSWELKLREGAMNLKEKKKEKSRKEDQYGKVNWARTKVYFVWEYTAKK